jgi:hypothetical protein
MCALSAELLEVCDAGVDGNFFDLSGDSLLRDLFTAPTVAELSRRM